MIDNHFLKNYIQTFSKIIQDQNNNIDTLLKIKDKLIETNNIGAKTIIFGNGGSAAMASHFSVDLTKNARVRCINCNESDLITCFSNDFGYEKWVEKSIEFYADKSDTIILISSSGMSLNMVNGANKAKEMGLTLITLTGHDSNNLLKKLGNLNLWVNSKAYNLIENAHQFLLLSIVDLIIGKTEYPPN